MIRPKGLFRVIVCFIVLVTAVAVEARPVKVGEVPPDFAAVDMNFKRIRLDQFKGNVIVLYFWNDSCGCGDQLIFMQEQFLAARMKNLKFLTINEGQPKSAAEAFMKRNNLTYDVILDQDFTIGKKLYQVQSLPTVFIIGKDGILKEKIIGIMPDNKLIKLIQSYL